MKMMAEEAVFSAGLMKRVLKNCGMVELFRCCVITRVRRPSTAHASSYPSSALPMPAHVAAMPYFQPN